MAKIKMRKSAEALTLRSTFQEFTISQSAKGVKDKPLQTYYSHFNAAAKHIKMDLTFAELTIGGQETSLVLLLFLQNVGGLQSSSGFIQRTPHKTASKLRQIGHG